MKTSKASVLAVSLIVMGVMIIIALGIASSSIQSRKSSIGSSQSNVAFQNADSGVEIVMQKIRDNSSGSLSAIDSDCNGIIEAAGKYKVELKDSSVPPVLVIGCGTPVSDVATIKSTGYSSQDSRAIKVAVAAAGGLQYVGSIAVDNTAPTGKCNAGETVMILTGINVDQISMGCAVSNQNSLTVSGSIGVALGGSCTFACFK